MPTPFNTLPQSKTIEPSTDWAATPPPSRRSVFGNYRPADSGNSPDIRSVSRSSASSPVVDPADPSATTELPTAAEQAIARSFLFRFLAKAFEDPTEDGWNRLTGYDMQRAFKSAIITLTHHNPALVEGAAACDQRLRPEGYEAFLSAYLAAFGHAARGRCPLNEIEYSDIKADPLFQPHRLADLAAFYRAFGLEITEDAGERHDHLSLELEFLCVLTAKEAYALEHQLDSRDLATCRDAQKKFLREHLGRWAPAFTRRLASMAAGTPLEALAGFLRHFIAAECERFGLDPGSDDLLLRPVDEAAESLCSSCGIMPLPRGAMETA